MSHLEPARQTTYGLLVFDGAEELDLVGPWEVFAAPPVAAGSRPTGRRRTTLEQRGDVTVVGDAPYVVDGKLVTSQGVSTGIDMALWLVGQINGRDHARAVRRYIQYEPAPPYQADEPDMCR